MYILHVVGDRERTALLFHLSRRQLNYYTADSVLTHMYPSHMHHTPPHVHTPSHTQFGMCLLLQSQLAHHMVRSCRDGTRAGLQTGRRVPRLTPSHASLPGGSCECNPHTSHIPHTSHNPHTSHIPHTSHNPHITHPTHTH